MLCRFSGDTPREVERFREEIVYMLEQGLQQKQIYAAIVDVGYQGKRTMVGDYCRRLVAELDISYAPRRNATGVSIKNKKIPKKRYISRHTFLNHAWTGSDIDSRDLAFIIDSYPQVGEILQCVSDFRRLYSKTDSLPLSCFIEQYKESQCQPLKSFASGLLMDVAAVQNSITSDLSNGFVEGLNTKIKAIKRLVYGRAKTDLLRLRVIHAR